MTKSWVRKKLGDVTAKIGSGATPLGGEESYARDGIALIRSLNVYDDGFQASRLARINAEQAARLSNVVVEPGDVLLNITGASIARCCLAPTEFLPARVNQHVSIIRPTPRTIDSNFLRYLLVSESYKSRLLQTGEDGGSTRQAITKAQLQVFDIEYPESLPEQKRIVGILDEAFAGITAVAGTAEQNARNARAVFESCRDSVIHRQCWELKTLGDLCERVEYGTSAKSKPTGRMPVLRMGNIQNERLDWSDLVYTDDDAEIAKYRLKEGDVLFNRTNSVELVGKSAIYMGERPALFAGYLIRIHRRDGLVDAGYLNCFLNSSAARDYGRTVMISSVSQANISGTKLLTYLMPTPPLSEQRAIVKKLDALREEAERLSGLYESKISALAALKQSLLHHAFTGQL